MTVENTTEDKLKDTSLKQCEIDQSVQSKIISELAGVVLPNLQNLLAEKSSADSFHKVFLFHS